MMGCPLAAAAAVVVVVVAVVDVLVVAAAADAAFEGSWLVMSGAVPRSSTPPRCMTPCFGAAPRAHYCRTPWSLPLHCSYLQTHTQSLALLWDKAILCSGSSCLMPLHGN